MRSSLRSSILGVPTEGQRDPSITGAERELLRHLDPMWFRGTSFAGTTREDAKRLHTAHYSAFVKLMDCSAWPAWVEGESAEGAEQTQELRCQVCGCTQAEFAESNQCTLVAPDQKPWQWVKSPGRCRLRDSWGMETPHVVHLECCVAGYLDSILLSGGVSMSGGKIILLPSCINKRKLLDLFDIVGVSAGEANAAGVQLRLKNPPSSCYFCSSLGLSDSTLDEMKDLGFCRQADSPQTVVSLLQSGSFSPLASPASKTVRPVFDPLNHADEVLKHAVPGTFVDFDGYRCTHLCVVLRDSQSILKQGASALSVRKLADLDSANGEDDNFDQEGDEDEYEYFEEGEYDEDEDDEYEYEVVVEDEKQRKFRVVSEARVDGLRYLRLRKDDAGFAVVPHGVVRFHGLPKLSRWPPDLYETLMWFCLTDYDIYTAEESDNVLSAVDDDTSDMYPVLSPPLQETDALMASISQYQRWLKEKMDQQSKEDPPKRGRLRQVQPLFGGSVRFNSVQPTLGGDQEHGSSTPSQRREWCRNELESLQRIVKVLQGERAPINDQPPNQNMEPNNFLSLRIVRHAQSELEQAFDAANSSQGCLIWGVKDGSHVISPQWKTKALEAVDQFVESRLSNLNVLPTISADTPRIDLRVASVDDRSRWPAPKDEAKVSQLLRRSTVLQTYGDAIGRDGWVRKVPVISAEHCRKVGYSTLTDVIALRGPKSGVYALELGDLSSHACTQHFVVSPVHQWNSSRSASCRLSHNATLSKKDEKHLHQLETMCIEALEAAQERFCRDACAAPASVEDDEFKHWHNKYEEVALMVAEEYESRARAAGHVDATGTVEIRIPRCTMCGQEAPMPMAVSTVKNAWHHYLKYGAEGIGGNPFHVPRVIEGRDYEGLDGGVHP